MKTKSDLSLEKTEIFSLFLSEKSFITKLKLRDLKIFVEKLVIRCCCSNFTLLKTNKQTLCWKKITQHYSEHSIAHLFG